MVNCPQCNTPQPDQAPRCQACGSTMRARTVVMTASARTQRPRVAIRMVRADGGPESVVAMRKDVLVCGRQGDIPLWLHVMFNAYWEALDFDLPLAPGAAVAGWQRWIDTSLDSPEDIMDAAAAPTVLGMHYRVAPRSVTVLVARTDDLSRPAIELEPK